MDSEKMSKEPDKSSTTRAGTKEAPKRREPGLLPPWKVLLHNDDVNTFEDVIHHVYRLTPLDAQASEQRVKEAHQSGVALLLVTHRERAELYVEQFASLGLTVTAEPDK